MDMVHLAGKGVCGRRVPLLLTSDVVLAMKLLVTKRDCCGIHPDNVFFFATSSRNGHITGWQIMKDVATAAKCERPELIHTTRLRKYIATVSQVIILAL